MPSTAVPMRLTPHGSLPVIAVLVNGLGPFDFIVDTGASHVVIGTDLATELDLPTGDGNLPGLGAGGAIAPAKTSLRELRVGHVVLRDIEAGILDLASVSRTAEAKISGILGYPFFADRVITIDYPNRELRLT
jgi:aspartyl protease